MSSGSAPSSPASFSNSSAEDVKVPLLQEVQSSDENAATDEKALAKQQRPNRARVQQEEAEMLSEGYLAEFRRILRLSAPLCVQNVLAYGGSIISMAFVGQLGAAAQAAAVLGTSFGNVTGYSILVGLSQGIETLSGQAYGARNFPLVGIILQRALGLQLAAYCIMWAIWAKIGSLLTLIGQDPTLSMAAERFIHLNSVSLLFGGINSCLNKYLQSQGVVLPSMIVLIFTTMLFPALNYLLIFRAGMGIDGAPITNGIVNIITFICLLFICRYYNRKAVARGEATWTGWSAQALKGWWPYLRLAVPALIMLCLEWWLFEALIIIAGYLPDAQVAVSVVGIGFNCSSLMYCLVALGVAGAASTRIANELGAGHPMVARRAGWLCLGMSFSGLTTIAIGVWALREYWVRVFTNDPTVFMASLSIMPFLAWSMMGDGFNGTVAGILHGTGQQGLGACINIFTYWGIGLPTILLLCFKAHLNLVGIYLGLAMTTTIQGLVMLVLVLRFNWAKLADTAYDRVGLKEKDGDEESTVIPGH